MKRNSNPLHWVARHPLPAAGIAALGALSWYGATYSGLTVTRREVQTSKWRPDRKLRLLVIADLHSQVWGKNQQKLLGKIGECAPDLIVMPGDIADEMHSLGGVIQLLEGLRGGPPVWYAPGNHEFRMGDRLPKALWRIRATGAHILWQRQEVIRVRGEQLLIAGILSPEGERRGFPVLTGKLLETHFSNISSSPLFTLAVAHHPEQLPLYAHIGFDLVTAGHAHGGQFRIPGLLHGLLAPGQGFFPKYTTGPYQEGSTTMLVSRGLYCYPVIPRVFNPPELLLITISGKD